MTPTPPRQYVVRRPSGDPGAARRLAAAYDDLAEDVRAQVTIVVSVLDQLGRDWAGAGAQALHAPQDLLRHDAAMVVRTLLRCADDLRSYAHRLEHAHEHHGWSIGRLVAMGAMVTVGVAAVVVTVGAAAPAEAAAAAAAVEGAEAATAAAGAAASGAATNLLSWQGLLAAVRPLAPFVVPHLLSSGTSVGIEGLTELVGSHHLDLKSLQVAAAVGFAGSASSTLIEARLAAASSTVRRLGEGGAYAAAGSTGQYVDDGEVDPVDSVASGVTGVVARDVRRAAEALHHRWQDR